MDISYSGDIYSRIGQLLPSGSYRDYSPLILGLNLFRGRLTGDIGDIALNGEFAGFTPTPYDPKVPHQPQGGVLSRTRDLHKFWISVPICVCSYVSSEPSGIFEFTVMRRFVKTFCQYSIHLLSESQVLHNEQILPCCCC